MQDKESLYPADWFEKAKKDLERVRPRLLEGDLEDATVHLQQAIEKYLKGYLLAKGWELKRIHDLRALLVEATKYNPDLVKFSVLCKEVTTYYFEERYPYPRICPSKEKIEKNLKEAEELIQELTKEEK